MTTKDSPGRFSYWKHMRQISRDREPIYKALSLMSVSTKAETLNFIVDLIKKHLPASSADPDDLARTALAIFRSAKTRNPSELVPYTRSQWQGSAEHATLDDVLQRRKLQREKDKAAGLPPRPKLTPKLVVSFIPDAGIRLPDLVLIVCRAARVDPKRVHSAFRKAQRAELVRLEKSTWFRASNE